MWKSNFQRKLILKRLAHEKSWQVVCRLPFFETSTIIFREPIFFTTFAEIFQILNIYFVHEILQKMKIVIAGAGAVGFHLAELLSRENQDITLIDTDQEILNYAASHLDVLTIRGDATSIAILEAAEIHTAKLFLAVTTSEKTNLLAAILAKQQGARKTIARVNNPEYLTPKQIQNFEKLGIGKLISPQQLAALEIERLLNRCSLTDILEFEGGKISLIGFSIKDDSHLIGKPISEICQGVPINFKAIAILRNHKTIILKEDILLQKNDHLYVTTENKNVEKITKLVGKEVEKIKRLMIIGSTKLALRTAQLLEKKYAITLIVDDENIGKQFTEILEDTLVVKADYSNIEHLKEEGLARMNAFIALTKNSEINIIASLMAEETKIIKTIALVDNVNYIHLSQNIGVDTLINKKLIAANEIFRFVRKGNIKAIASLHGVDGEIIEFVIHRKNKLLKHAIEKLDIPVQAIIAGVVRGQRSIIPKGDFVFELNDKVIVFALPEAIYQVEQLFK